MLLALLIGHLVVLTVGNPFHKYPFVFLLDVGNEELEKTNTEQIRITIPGGSIALRYPAIGDGETISHIRVSGIDFGTDLKANIVDGGPGYKYVVLVFMGNPGVPYDAVMTVQTVPSDKTFSYDVQNIENASKNGKSYVISEENDANDSAEDLSDDTNGSVNIRNAYYQKKNAEIMQSSTNVYKYVQNEAKDGDYGDSYNVDAGDDIEDQKDIHAQYSKNIDPVDEGNVESKEYIESNAEDDQNENYADSNADRLSEENDYTSYDDKEPMRVVDNNSYQKYEPTNDNLYGGAASQDEQDLNVIPGYQDSIDEDDPLEFEQIFNDEEIHNEKYQDSNNNNYIDSDDSSAVAY